MVLTVSDPTGKIRARERIKIQFTEPTLHLYEDHPLRGIQYSKTLTGDHTLTSSEGTLVAEPYFYVAGTRSDTDLNYAWDIAGQKLTTPGRIVLRPEGGGAGNARIQLVVKNALIWQQNDRKELTIYYGTGGSSGPETTPL
jgi:hypothetical protein